MARGRRPDVETWTREQLPQTLASMLISLLINPLNSHQPINQSTVFGSDTHAPWRPVQPVPYHNCLSLSLCLFTTNQPIRPFHPSPLSFSASTMSTGNRTTDLSTANFTAIFDAALNEYKTLTKQNLEIHPFTAAFENSNSPGSVMDVLRKQAQVLDKFHKGDDKLMAWLTPIVNILFSLSGILEAIGIVSNQPFIIYQPYWHLFFLAFLSLKDDIHWHWCTSWGPSIFYFPYMSIHILFNSDSEGCRRELQSALETFRAHSIFPSTSSSLHISPTHTGDDGATRENHGPNYVYPCSFDQLNEGEAN